MTSTVEGENPHTEGHAARCRSRSSRPYRRPARASNPSTPGAHPARPRVSSPPARSRARHRPQQQTKPSRKIPARSDVPSSRAPSAFARSSRAPRARAAPGRSRRPTVPSWTCAWTPAARTARTRTHRFASPEPHFSKATPSRASTRTDGGRASRGRGSPASRRSGNTRWSTSGTRGAPAGFYWTCRAAAVCSREGSREAANSTTSSRAIILRL